MDNKTVWTEFVDRYLPEPDSTNSDEKSMAGADEKLEEPDTNTGFDKKN